MLTDEKTAASRQKRKTTPRRHTGGEPCPGGRHVEEDQGVQRPGGRPLPLRRAGRRRGAAGLQRRPGQRGQRLRAPRGTPWVWVGAVGWAWPVLDTERAGSVSVKQNRVVALCGAVCVSARWDGLPVLRLRNPIQHRRTRNTQRWLQARIPFRLHHSDTHTHTHTRWKHTRTHIENCTHCSSYLI